MIRILIVLVLVLTGCTRVIDAKPVTEPLQLDCNLIFPGPGGA